MADNKLSTQRAVQNFIKKECLPRSRPERKKKNRKPERKTESDCLSWCRENNIFVHVVEASSYDPITGRKTFSRAAVGMPDLVGNTANGSTVWIELKAKDRRYTLREHQRHFLIQKIEQNCFAVVVDSVDKLDQYFREFCRLKSKEARQTYLLDCLPRKRSLQKNPRDDFEKQYGF